MQPLILASSSPYRKALLQRLGLAFEVVNPEVDETPLPSETGHMLVQRLATTKAEAVGQLYPHALIIGSDQVAVLEDSILGKPGDHERAVAQLWRLSGRTVEFLSAVTLLNAENGHLHAQVVPTTVRFRKLSDAQIMHYLAHEPAYNCAGSFKSEGLGISLLEAVTSDDPTALIGLPLICLTTMLASEGRHVL